MTCPPETEVVVGVDLVPFLRDLGRHQQVGCWFYMQQWIALGLVFVDSRKDLQSRPWWVDVIWWVSR